MICFILLLTCIPSLFAYSLLKQRTGFGHATRSTVYIEARSDEYIEGFRSDLVKRRDDRVDKVVLQEAGTRHRRFGQSDSLSPKEDLSVKLLGRILKACRVIPRMRKTLHEVVQVSLFSLSEVSNLAHHPPISALLTFRPQMNLAIMVAGKRGRLQDAITVFENIPTMGYQPDIKSYNNMIWAAGHCGHDDIAHRYYQDLLHSEQQFIPNVFTYSALMHAYARAQKADKALDLLKTLLSNKEEINLVVFGAAMDACAEAGRAADAMWILDQVIAMGLSPDLAMLSTVVKACLAAGEVAKANDIVQYVVFRAALNEPLDKIHVSCSV